MCPFSHYIGFLTWIIVTIAIYYGVKRDIWNQQNERKEAYVCTQSEKSFQHIEKKGLLQQDLADELAKEGITISYKAISNWERNLAEPSVTIFYKVCRILGITNMYEAYFGVNPADPFSSLTDEGREKAMDYINLLHASGMYEKQTAKIIPFRSIDIFENAVSAGTGNFL